ncbi:glutamyl aminopeptidase-like [Formica exsecta]|uniref:glutamyl aminopeptidase-like n=1 Tax=Formica exsecta TaxID=72781 RepID=UPI001143BBE6|nr:glutamyl aminopeptidase-like [Formica exsecta]XP_029665620.1 glutamyl aminopeptidase-like [Formica exsecta]XP_029665621.1 glutamyl aminopeptidase-like [Formica exsecta]
MTFLRLLLYGVVIFITATALSADENREDIIDKSITNKIKDYTDYVKSKDYDVKLIPYFKEDKERDDIYITFKTDIEEYQANDRFVFYGEITAIIHIFQPTTKLRLSSSNSIRLLSGELTQKSAVNIRPEDYYHYLAEKIEYNNITQTCDLHFKEELSRGNYTANIKFLNAINISGENNIFLKTTYINKSENVISWDKTHFPMVEVQRLFPCWDNPTVRSTFNVSIKHYCSYSVFSNMPIKEILKYKLNNTEICMQWTYFDTTPSIPAHLVMVMISSMHFFPNYGKDNIYIWRNPYSDDIQFAERVSNKVIMKLKFEWFKSLKKLKVKIPNLQLVAIPGFRNDINMNFGFVAIRETSIIYDENLHSVAHKIEAARLIARGITYQWFGNLINQPWMSDLWLSDGLTTLFEMEAVNAINALEHYTNSEILDLLIVQFQYESLQLDDYNFTQALTSEISYPEINSLFSYSRYIKAPLILRMLQYLVTKEVFWKSVHRYLNMQQLSIVLSTLDVGSRSKNQSIATQRLCLLNTPNIY